jgi:hypothetical protein
VEEGLVGPFGEDPIPEGVRQALERPETLEALAQVFLRNCRDEAGARRRFAPGEPLALAREVARALLDPYRFRQVEVLGIRFDLEAGSTLYPKPAVVWASVWDDDAEVWRRVGSVELG